MLGTLANKQALSEGVLDQRGDLERDQDVGGRETFMQRLESFFPDLRRRRPPQATGRQARDRTAGSPDVRPPADLDRTRRGPAARVLPARGGVAQRRADLLRGTFPVPRRSVGVADGRRERGRALARRTPTSGTAHFSASHGGEPAPAVRLEVVDRATAELLRRLAESGVVSPSLRASRVLFPSGDAGATRRSVPRNKTVRVRRAISMRAS